MKTLPKNPLIRYILAGSLIFYIFSGISSVLNYAFYPIVARFVSVSEYGEIQFLVSMFAQLAVGFVVLNILAIIISVKIKSVTEQRQVIKSLNLVSSLVILVIVIIGSTVLYLNKSNLGLTNNLAILALGFSLIVNVPFTVVIGQLQGAGRFMASGVVNMLATLLKLVLSTLFVILGFGVTGAILGIGIGMLVSLIATIIFRKVSTPKTNEPTNANRSIDFKNLIFVRKQALVAIFAISAITLISSADSIVSRIFLDSNSAGQYAAVATIAKVILAATSPIMWLSLPPAVSRDRRQILKLALITAVIATIASLLFSIFPTLFVQGLLGINVGSYLQLITPASISMALCSLGFVLIGVSICLAHLRHIVIATVTAIILYFSAFYILSGHTGPLLASLYGQMLAAVSFIIGGSLALRQRYFK